jgi:hypothetical protein
VLAVEACLVESLPTIFCPETVLDIEDDIVAALAAENEDSLAERAQSSEKLKVLENGLRELKSIKQHPSLRPNSK